MLCENLKLIRQWEVSLSERVLSVHEIDFGNFPSASSMEMQWNRWVQFQIWLLLVRRSPSSTWTCFLSCSATHVLVWERRKVLYVQRWLPHSALSNFLNPLPITAAKHCWNATKSPLGNYTSQQQCNSSTIFRKKTSVVRLQAASSHEEAQPTLVHRASSSGVQCRFQWHGFVSLFPALCCYCFRRSFHQQTLPRSTSSLRKRVQDLCKKNCHRTSTSRAPRVPCVYCTRRRTHTRERTHVPVVDYTCVAKSIVFHMAEKHWLSEFLKRI